VEAGNSKHGNGPEAGVEIKLRDGRKLKGYISATGANNFVIVDAKSGCFDDSISASQTGNRQQSFKGSQNRDHSWDCGRPAISLNCSHWSYLVSTFFYTCDQHLTKSFSYDVGRKRNQPASQRQLVRNAVVSRRVNS